MTHGNCVTVLYSEAHRIGGLQVEAESAGARGEKEDEVRAVLRIELSQHPPPAHTPVQILLVSFSTCMHPHPTRLSSITFGSSLFIALQL